MPPTTKILIVDDSAVMRNLLRIVVQSDKRLEVAGTASDGLTALKLLDSLNPDLILLDIEMPVMDGLTTLRQIRSSGRRIPTIMCSSLTQRGAQVTLEALANGAADYVAKPSGHASSESAIEALAHDLVPKILALTTAHSHGVDRPPPFLNKPIPVLAAKPTSVSFSPAPKPFFPPQPTLSMLPMPVRAAAPQSPPSLSSLALPVTGLAAPPASAPAPNPAVVLIGVSTGGPAALDALLPQLPANFALPILIVQHMPGLFTKMLAERLNSKCPMRVTEAAEGEEIKPGTIYIAKGDWHMGLSATRPLPGSPLPQRIAIRLSQSELENHCRPAVDVLFRSAVPIFGARTLGIILTGMGADGLIGCRLIRQHGGTVLAQDEQSSAIWGMPGAVAQAGLAHRVLPLNQIAAEILRLTAKTHREAHELRESAV